MVQDRKQPPFYDRDRCAVIQRFLDHIDNGWHVAAPSPDNNDPDVCSLKNAASGKVAHAVLPEKWFSGGMDGYIEWEIRRALKQAAK